VNDEYDNKMIMLMMMMADTVNHIDIVGGPIDTVCGPVVDNNWSSVAGLLRSSRPKPLTAALRRRRQYRYID